LESATAACQTPNFLDPYAPIAADLEHFERILAETLTGARPCVTELVRHLRHYRGKRLRPALLLLSARACGDVTPAHHLLAAVVEMIHTATLVHDDILDEAARRRHVPTINARWGNQTGVLLGDYLFTHAFHLASQVDARACRIIGESTNRVCEGELYQGSERGNLNLTEQDYFDIIDSKTAELTCCCCRLGALYSGSADFVVESMSRYGRWLGIAFQIADDVLDLFGDEAATGKSLGTDLEQHKLTLPLIRLLEQLPRTSLSHVEAILRSPGNHKRQALQAYFDTTDALAYAQARAENYAERARDELDCLPASVCRSVLQQLTERVVHRMA
jgi:octaprenyl-diphosphate synthase